MNQNLVEESRLSWKIKDFEALCSLDAARFRLPLATMVRSLLARAPRSKIETLIIDAPGITRGVAGAELLLALIAAAQVDLVLTLVHKGQPQPLNNELSACNVEHVSVIAHSQASRPAQASRRRERTRLWQAFLTPAVEQTLRLDQLALLGTPPPTSAPMAWTGRQVAVLDKKRTLVMGQVVSLDKNKLRILVPDEQSPLNNPQQLLIRDAVQTAGKGLHTAKAAELSGPPK